MKRLIPLVLAVALAIGVAAPAFAAGPCPPLPAGTVQVTHGAIPGPDAYFQTAVTGGGLDGTYEGWCIDIHAGITRGTTYEANVLCSYSPAASALVITGANWDLVNWILNQDLVGKDSGVGGIYTYGDVQRAIWQLLENGQPSEPSNAGTTSAARINKIMTDAASHDGFVPEPGDLVAVVLQPVSGAQASLITLEVPEEFEGLTPGFWKNHTDLWAEPYDKDDLVGDVFAIPAALTELADDTLLEALNYSGGKGDIGMARNLLRAAVAALLNAAHPEINYAMSEAGIISAVNTALNSGRTAMETLKDQLDGYNNAGGGIDAHGNPV